MPSTIERKNKMYSEREIQHKVETAVKSVVKSDSDTITPKQLTDVLTKVLCTIPPCSLQCFPIQIAH